MKRISDEDGFNAGWRNIGRFVLTMIPFALGIGLFVWIADWLWIHEIKASLQMEDRAAIYTGAENRPKSKVTIEVLDKSCVKVTHADLNGRDLRIYGKAECLDESLKYYSVYAHWQQLSPDGTILHEHYMECGKPQKVGDKVECTDGGWDFEKPTDDDRVATLRVWISAP